MTAKSVRRVCITMLAAYGILVLAFFWIAGDQLRFREEVTEAIKAVQPVGELVRGMEARQGFTVQADELLCIELLLSTYNRKNTAHLVVRIEDAAGMVLAENEVQGLEIEDNALRKISFIQPVPLTSGERYELVLSSPDGAPGNAVTAWLGSSVSAARAEIPMEIAEQDRLQINGETRDGMLSFSVRTRSYLWFGGAYWHLAAAFGVLLAGYCVYLCQMSRRGKSCLALRLISAFQRYGYLVRQLVARDFKTKYKRSVLGVLWSFLNPLLTMMVQYIVFSTLFRSDIPNFRLYLLSGIVCFNFFSEASGMALQSIVGNASLITKVYVPKYIYPVTRVLSSTINLLLSLIPLLAVMLLTKTPLRPAILLLPFGLICLIAFCTGMGLILSTMMVFFRDTQFLWGVVSMLWMYATPIFYPESIIPAQYMTLYKCNPMYHIIRFVRCVLINGVSPEPKAYALCLIACFVPLLLGAVIFKKNQDKFILNL